MLITFTSKASPDVVLFGEIASIFLRVMGEREQPPGILRGENIRLAQQRLQTWLQDVPDESGSDEDEENDTAADGDTHEKRGRVGMEKRALPLLEMLNAAYQQQNDVIWR